MSRLFLALALLGLVATAAPATAEPPPANLIGAWRLANYKLQVVGEDVTEPFGAAPKGTLVVSPNSRWTVMLTAAERKPAGTDAERAALLGSMIAWTGKFTVEGDRITSKVDTSWNEIYTGRLETQTRFYKLEGDTLTIRSPEMESAVRPGKRIVATLVFRREN